MPYLHSAQGLFSAINQATSGLEIHSPNMASQAHSSLVQTDSTAEQEQSQDEFLTNPPSQLGAPNQDIEVDVGLCLPSQLVASAC